MFDKINKEVYKYQCYMGNVLINKFSCKMDGFWPMGKEVE